MREEISNESIIAEARKTYLVMVQNLIWRIEEGDEVSIGLYEQVETIWPEITANINKFLHKPYD